MLFRNRIGQSDRSDATISRLGSATAIAREGSREISAAKARRRADPRRSRKRPQEGAHMAGRAIPSNTVATVAGWM